jgi:dolichyl-phosphate-mannose-protein mannosyltransferase
MIEPARLASILDPVHPPLAEQLLALSIETFEDAPRQWRYPSVLWDAGDR